MAKALSSNRNYLVSIQQGRGGGDKQVQANATASLQLRVENRWVNVLEALGFSGDSSGAIGSAVGSAFNTFQLFTGNNFLPNIATSHVWRGSNGIEINLVLRFDAYDDAQKDVVDPVKKLIKMFMPTRQDSGGALNPGQFFLYPPGPTPKDYISGDKSRLFSVTIGKFMLIDELIPVMLEYEFLWRPTERGPPVAANVTAGFMSYTIPTAEKVLDMFLTR